MATSRVAVQTDSYDFSGMQKEINEILRKLGQEKDIRNVLKQVPVADMKLGTIFAPETLERLLENPSRCASNAKRGQRCLKGLGSSVSHVPDILKDLVSMDILAGWNQVRMKLENLSACSFCGYHKNYALEDVDALGARISRPPTTSDSSSSPQIKHDRYIATEWFNTIRNIDAAMIYELRHKMSQIPPKKRHSRKRNQTAKKPLPLATQIHEFIPFQPKSQCRCTWDEVLRRRISKELTREKLRSGYIYIFWYPGTFGMLKIGVTNNVPRRLKAWRKQCGYPIKEHLQFGEYHRILFTQARIVELLVHVALKEVRRKEVGCKGCGRTHREWFATTPKHATFIILQIAFWLAENPIRYNKARKVWEFPGSMDDLVDSLGAWERNSEALESFEHKKITVRPTTRRVPKSRDVQQQITVPTGQSRNGREINGQVHMSK